MTRIVCIGEAMVELAPASVAGHFQRAYAGDTLNTAWYLKRLRPEAQVDFVSRVGDDAISDEMMGFLDSQGIGTGFLRQSDTKTLGLYMIDLKEGARSFSYWRGQSAARELADDPQWLAKTCAGADLVYVSGITLAILGDVGRAKLLDVLRGVRVDGARVAFDSNLRPRLWPDLATMCDAVMEAAAVSDLVLPSHDDEATYFGDADPGATLARYLSAGASSVVVKNGHGVILYAHDGEQGQFQPAAIMNVVDTTAAGDSFNAGIFAGYLDGAPMADAVQLASRLAGQVIQGRGALVASADGK